MQIIQKSHIINSRISPLLILSGTVTTTFATLLLLLQLYADTATYQSCNSNTTRVFRQNNALTKRDGSIFQWLAVPFAFMADEVSDIRKTSPQWLGKLETSEIGSWLDSGLLLIFGGIPWQVAHIQWSLYFTALYFKTTLDYKTT